MRGRAKRISGFGETVATPAQLDADSLVVSREVAVG
jgi:hypothetical protein